MSILTIEVDDRTLEALSVKASAEQSTVDKIAQAVLEEYAERQHAAQQAMATIRRLQKVIDTSGQKFTRDEMNERRIS